MATILQGNVQFTQAQIAYIWTQAGGAANMAPLMSAIAMAESSGNSAIYNDICCYGLWQINANHGYSVTAMINPLSNGQEAVAILGSQGLGAWETYTNGDYLTWYNPNIVPDSNVSLTATSAAAGITGGSGQGGQQAQDTSFIGGLTCTIAPVICAAAGFVQNQTASTVMTIIKATVGMYINPMIQIFAGILGITGGGIMMIGGVWVIVGQTQPGATAERGVKGAAQLGIAAAAPETMTETGYAHAQGVTTVRSYRRRGVTGPGGIPLRQPTTRTEVMGSQYGSGPPDVPQQLNTEAEGYVNPRGPSGRRHPSTGPTARQGGTGARSAERNRARAERRQQ